MANNILLIGGGAHLNDLPELIEDLLIERF